MNILPTHTHISIRPWWKHPAAWVSAWLLYSLTVLAYLAYDSAQRGIFCLSIS